MAWNGKFLGKWLGNWLGSITTSRFPVTAVSITILVPTLTVVVSQKVSVQSITVTAPTAVATGKARTVVGVTQVTITALPVTAIVKDRIIVGAASIQIAPITVSTYGSATTVVTPCIVTTVVPSGSVYASSLTNVTPSIITLVISSVKVYGWQDQYLRVKAIMVKINTPELLAFSTDITTDMEVVEAMEVDMESMDGTQQVKLLRKTDNIVYDFTSGQAIPENKIYTFNTALIRAISDRENRTIRQLRQAMSAVQNDELHTMDTIIELPMRSDVQIVPGDVVQADLLGTQYVVVGIDTCTLKTRWRLGARKLV